jgi:O-acetyl-ADP-ribose deacetylase
MIEEESRDFISIARCPGRFLIAKPASRLIFFFRSLVQLLAFSVDSMERTITHKPDSPAGAEADSMERDVQGRKLILVQGDLTELQVDAIVNAANTQLILGGGVAGAIRSKGGPGIQEECNGIGGTVVGQAVVTGGGNLKARYVIHAVGPRYGEGNEDEKLRQATLNSLRRAAEIGLESLAFPAVSTGIFGFPKDRCAQIMLATTRDFLKTEPSGLRAVWFCLWSAEDFKIFQDTLQSLDL